MNNLKLTIIFFVLTLTGTGCCVLDLDNISSEPNASIGGSCVNTGASGGSPLFGFQIGNYFILDPQSCAGLGEIGLGAGALLSRRGSIDESEFMEDGDGIEPISYSQKATLNTYYLDIPIIAQVPITGGLSIYGGPQASVLLGAKRSYEINGQGGESQKGTEGLNGLDLGFTLGLKYELNNGLQLGLGLDQGLRDVYKSDYGSSKSKNQVVKATFGLNINKFKNR